MPQHDNHEHRANAGRDNAHWQLLGCEQPSAGDVAGEQQGCTDQCRQRKKVAMQWPAEWTGQMGHHQSHEANHAAQCNETRRGKGRDDEPFGSHPLRIDAQAVCGLVAGQQRIECVLTVMRVDH